MCARTKNMGVIVRGANTFGRTVCDVYAHDKCSSPLTGMRKTERGQKERGREDRTKELKEIVKEK